MPDKIFTFEGRTLTIHDPTGMAFANPFFGDLYRHLFASISTRTTLAPFIDFDAFRGTGAGIDILALAIANAIPLPSATGPNAQRTRTTKAMLAFLQHFPAFFNFFKNLNADADVAIRAAEFIAGAPASAVNFINIKKIIDDWNRDRWVRDKDTNERQAGVSTLGTISERLLEIALEEHIDEEKFFKNNNTDIQSYGDFVLMCLPNNLWMSVKSNFARERLLASGFTTDIVGVGFFTDYSEFTSASRIRNFQKVGFLAMYVPDIPVTEEQADAGQSTFSLIEHHYTHADIALPLNINGKLFIRRLSELNNDIRGLLSETDLKRRTTIGF